MLKKKKKEIPCFFFYFWYFWLILSVSLLLYILFQANLRLCIVYLMLRLGEVDICDKSEF